MSQPPEVSRRDFLKVSSLAGIGLVIEVYLAACGQRSAPTPVPVQPTGLPSESPVSTQSSVATIAQASSPTPPAATIPQAGSPTPAPLAASEVLAPSLYLKIGKNGLVTITIPRSEMGQGVRTALAMIVAEELCADWSTIRLEQAPGDRSYGDQTTGGSTSIQTFYDILRRAGGVARQLLVQAAAETWNVEPVTCFAEKNTVVHQGTGQRLAYADLVDQAGGMPVPKTTEVQLKKPSEFTILGTNVPRFDGPQLVSGRAIYGLDVRLPGMLYASVTRPPVLGGQLASFDPARAEQVAGVRAVVPIDCGVAVVAEDTWAAMQGRNALDVVWKDSPLVGLDSRQIEKDLVDEANAAANAGQTQAGEISGVYVFPYFAHATMEPMNCTADVRADSCEIWVPTQNPQAALSRAVWLAGVPQSSVRVNVTLLGGGFGRRLEMSPGGSVPPASDYVAQAVQISKAVGAPVQVVWSREDDLRYDLFHPISVTRVSARLEDIQSLRMQKFTSSAAVPSGYWRSVTNPPDAFAHECFLDEYAVATGVDPLELHRKILSPKDFAPLALAAEKAGWGQPLPEGHGRGLAFHSTWGVTGVAEVVEVSVDGVGGLHVHRVVCGVDCGLAINPDMVVAQVESGVAFGLTAVMKEQITIEQGQVMQSNFNNFPLLRFDEMPQVEVYLVPSQEKPTGLGEMGNPPLAPAVANAIFAATGRRIRRIPVRPPDLIG